MRIRCLVLMSALAAVIIGSLASVLIAGQVPTTAAGTWTPHRTPWGEPDLQGIWIQNEHTPLERPKEYAGRAFLTDEEVAELDQTRARNIELAPKFGPSTRQGKGTEHDVAGAYNNVFTSFRKTGRRTSLITDPPDGKIPPYTPAGEKRLAGVREYLSALLQGTSGGKAGPLSPRRAEAPPIYNVDRMNRADGPEDRSLRERCQGTVLPFLGGEDPIRLVQSPGNVAIYYEADASNGNRIIPVDGSPRLPQPIRQWLGDARGRWEGNTLVVDTTNFSPKSDFRGSRENLHLVERFTRVDTNMLEIQTTIDDPTTWTRPWTVTLDLTKSEDKYNRIFERDCQEGNYGLTGILANTRAAEKAFAEGRGPDPATMDTATGGGGGGPTTPID